MTLPLELTADQLRRRCDITQFPFATTAEAPELTDIIGQARATRAIEFGLEIPYVGYNIFATGPAGAGKTSIITGFLQRKAATRPVPPDWGYVHNFSDPDRPRAIRLPPGGGSRLRNQINALLAQLAEALPRVFASDQYAGHRNAIERERDQLRSERFRELEAFAIARGFALAQTPMGVMIAPAKAGKPLTPEQFEALPLRERTVLEEKSQEVQEALERTGRQVREIEAAMQERLRRLDQEVAISTIRPLFKPLLEEYADWPDVKSHLELVQAHIAEHAEDFKRRVGREPQAPSTEQGADEGEGRPPVDPQVAWWQRHGSSPYDRYRLNVIVDNAGLQGAPVIVETNPTYANLVGRVEMRAEFGTLVSDYRYIKSGALHRANGGYLVLDARSLLRQPLAWEALKQALRNGRIRIEDIGQQIGILASITISPEPIPLDIKVVLIGDPQTYYLLYAYDEQFEKLFKVHADFAVEMNWNAENEGKIVQFIRNRCEESGLPHFDLSAVARVVEFSGRLVEDQRKLSTRFSLVADIIQEAAFWAGRAQRQLVTAEDVTRAIDERVYRSNQFEERLREMIVDGTIMVDTTGARVGQVNGLSVLDLGEYEFGRPNRVTVRTFQGRAGVINIEREARLSGRIHDKGVLILSGFLGGRYAQDKPLSLSASIAFEQSYEGIEGDSASSTELYALLSSLAEAPIKQGIAATGSVNQYGEIQAVGGVTAKIEGFFETCRAMPAGLTGEQGVIIPAANVPNLMLRDEVVQAVAEGKFHIWPVRTVDEGIAILTGLPAGERGPDGSYPADTINGRVDRKLRELAEKLQQFGQTRENRDKKNGETSRTDGEGEPQPTPGTPELPGDQPDPTPE